MKICVIGLGPVGLSLLAASLNYNHEVLALDLSQQVIEEHKRKISGSKPDINVNEYRLLKKKYSKLEFVTTYDERLKEIEAFFICVPTEAVMGALKEVSLLRNEASLIFIESTVYPAMIPVFETLIQDEDRLIISPERIMEGKLLQNLYTYVKVIGVKTDEAFKNAVKIYELIGMKSGWMFQCTPEEACMTKVVENAYRYWTIRFGHIVADIVREIPNCKYENIMEGVNTRPDRELPYSGLGIGGDCLEENMKFLIRQAKHVGVNSEELEKKLEYEYYRKSFNIPKMIADVLGMEKERHILVMGAAYRPDGQSIRNSPSKQVYDGIKRTYKETYIYDPDVEETTDVVTERLCEFIAEKNINTIVLALPSYTLKKDFEILMMNFPEMTFINLTQWETRYSERLDYVWLPC